MERVRPERIGVAFDLSLRSETSFRNGIYPAYKANREAPPADLERQFALCREFCRHMGIAEFASARYEADDIIGTLAARSRAAGLCNVLVTRDKDLSQLIRDGDVFWDYSGNTRYHYHDIGPALRRRARTHRGFLGADGAIAWTIFPECRASAKRPAAELFAVFGSLDELYANLDRIPSMKLRGAAAVAARLLEHKDAAYLARRLTGIVCDIPRRATLDDLKRRTPDSAGAGLLFRYAWVRQYFAGSRRAVSPSAHELCKKYAANSSGEQDDGRKRHSIRAAGGRVFPPSAQFREQAQLKEGQLQGMYAKAADDYVGLLVGFWRRRKSTGTGHSPCLWTTARHPITAGSPMGS